MTLAKLPQSPYEILQELYKNPKYSILSESKFTQKVRQLHPEIKRKDIEDFISSQTLQQTFSSRPFKGYYKIVAKPYTFQTDLFFLDEYASYNKKHGSFLIMVDILSRKMYVHPLKSKTLESIQNGLETLIRKVGKVVAIETDDEFNKSSIKTMLEEKGISFRSIVAKQEHLSKGNSLGIVDSATRTIKKYIKKYMVQNNTPKFINVLDDLVEAYNQTPHSSLFDKTPEEVYDNEKTLKKIFKEAALHNSRLDSTIDLNIGDFARKANDKNKFEKEKQMFSKDIFVIYDQEGKKFRLIDEDGKVDDDRLYKYHELMKVDPEKTLTPSSITIYAKHHGKSNKNKRKGGDLDEVDRASKEYRRVKKIVKRLKKEGIDVNEAVIKRKRDTSDDDTTIAERVSKRKVIQVRRSTRNRL
jgi:anthranilate/para-aminobenzoate synthase component I